MSTVASLSLPVPTLFDTLSADSILVALLVLAGIGSVIVFTLAVLALHRRRSTPHLLIVGALGALVGRTVVGLSVYAGLLTTEFHHVIEHGLDVVIAVLLLGAIYAVGPLATGDRSPSQLSEYESAGRSE